MLFFMVKKDFVHVIKNLKMGRLSCIIQVRPIKYSHIDHHASGAGDLTAQNKWESNVIMEAECSDRPETKKCQLLPEARKGRTDFLFWGGEGLIFSWSLWRNHSPADTLVWPSDISFRLLASRTVRE